MEFVLCFHYVPEMALGEFTVFLRLCWHLGLF